MAITSHPLFRLLDTPAGDAAMGGCYIYHTQDSCIDTGVLVAFEGNLTLGLQALREMCEVAGFRFNEEGVAIERENAELQYDNALYQLRIAEVERLLADVYSQLGRKAAGTTTLVGAGGSTAIAGTGGVGGGSVKQAKSPAKVQK